jgi:hypothetical protein
MLIVLFDGMAIPITWHALYRSSTIPGISLITGANGRTSEGHCSKGSGE